MPEQLKPPKWYSADEIYEWFNRKSPLKITKVQAKWLSDEFQKAFNKGFDMAVSQYIKAWNQRSAPGGNND
ncbi:hypothetical protein KAR91_52015 [Candidatus Pacearchaeota archaeon]|nr:hypothetical protein [Candidatus Pacearchaeota archaeon]